MLTHDWQQELIEFAQSLVRIRSYTGEEGEIVRWIEARMKALGYTEVVVDAMGNLLGRISDGPAALLLDAHVDTVAVHDAEQWAHPPFDGVIDGGRLHGRGSVDMKSAAAAAIYAGALAAQQGWTAGKSVYVSCTVMEEDCDGENLKHLLAERSLRPAYALICEPSNNRITLGHKGKVQVAITTHGVSAHGATPEQGINAVYEMAEIIGRVERANGVLAAQAAPSQPRPTLVLSRIRSVSASLNAVPSECEIYLDRRLVPGETSEAIRAEMDALIAGKRATWQVGALERTSWTGLPVTYEPFHLAWRIDPGHPLAQACLGAYRAHFGADPDRYEFWDFSTNAVTPVSLGIPTIGFGPGDHKQAHMRDESCPVGEIMDACGFYARVIERVSRFA